MKNLCVTFHAYDDNDREVESCFTITVAEDLAADVLNDSGMPWARRLIERLAPDMARLQGLDGSNVTIALIEEDKS